LKKEKKRKGKRGGREREEKEGGENLGAEPPYKPVLYLSLLNFGHGKSSSDGTPPPVFIA